jgi:hypothetical protein
MITENKEKQMTGKDKRKNIREKFRYPKEYNFCKRFSQYRHIFSRFGFSKMLLGYLPPILNIFRIETPS